MITVLYDSKGTNIKFLTVNKLQVYSQYLININVLLTTNTQIELRLPSTTSSISLEATLSGITILQKESTIILE